MARSRYSGVETTSSEWVPTPTNLRFKRALEKLDRVVLGLIAERRKGGGPQNDLLAMLMEWPEA